MRMKVSRRTKFSGFTIVELIIVIVVISILVAITVVSYNRAQEQAESTKTINQAKAYIDGLLLWNADAGRPSADSCIAPVTSLTAGACPLAGEWTVNVPYASAPYDATFNKSLADYSGITTILLGRYGGDNPKGLMWYQSNYGNDNRDVLYYSVGPNSDCGLPHVLSPNPGYDNLTLLDADYTARTSTGTQCMVEVFKY